jgi:hypothetical protein
MLPVEALLSRERLSEPPVLLVPVAWILALNQR